MKQFFKFMFASIAGFFITGFVLMLIFFAMLGGMLSSKLDFDFGSEKPFSLKDNSILHLTMTEEIIDRTSPNQMNFDFSSFKPKNNIGLNEFIKNIEKAKENDKIKGIFLDLSSLNVGMASLEEIRESLLDFKESGKFIISFGEVYSQKAYYLASISDEVMLYPEGLMEMKGLSTEIMFLKGLFEKLDINMQVIRGRNNKFKSAVEPYMLDKMSDANREQTQQFLGSMWNYMLANIASSRGLSVDELNTIADEMLIRKAEHAVTYKLIDRVAYRDEVVDNLKERLGVEDEKKLNLVTFNQFKRSSKKSSKGKKKSKETEEVTTEKGKIAVIYAIGAIESGDGDDETIGSDRIAKAIRQARKDTTVSAIVLRVNSPGGSALASDVMWRETILAKKEKPFVVSMGDVAASGGYYIACAADKIFAKENTITGSIGVFGVLPDAQGFFNKKMGITFDRVMTNDHADMGTFSRALTDKEYRVIQEGVEDIYDDFLTKVAEGRNMTKEAVDEIGQGRVWSGIDAKRIGLIDEFGGLKEAIAAAAELAEIEDYKIKEYPEIKDPFQEFIKSLSGETQVEAKLKLMFPNEFRIYNQVKDVEKMEGVQARLPFVFKID
jgi:protease IV